ncbi:MAG: endonuclease III [Bacteroidetes bacterium]|nr:endonuclease III [Bacteroidota bacterium]MCH8524226.1 endonuclease III [Balneolales bacterium]
MPRPLSKKKRKEIAAELLDVLYTYYPNPHCELNFTTPFELLIATILSAQCTDVRVNMVTEKLFKKYPSPQHFMDADLAELEIDVKPTGFYRNKALSIKETATRIMEVYGGEVPQNMDDLLTLRGAARKTANVVLGNAFGINHGVVVDTHVRRLSNRFGLTVQQDPVKIEKDLIELFPQGEWTNISHLMILHGRAACKARFAKAPDHEICRNYGVRCECGKMREQSEK